MNRRAILERLSLASTTVFVAGCGGEYGDGTIVRSDSGAEPADENGDENRQPCREKRPEWADGEPYEQYAVPDDGLGELESESTDNQDSERSTTRADPYRVWLRNATEETQSIEFTVSDGEEPILDEHVDLPAGEYLEIAVFDLERVGLRLETGGSRVETTVSQSGDAARHSQTTITVREGGIETESETVQRSVTDVDVEEASLNTLERSCASGDADVVTVELEGSTVFVEGSAETPTPCHALSLSEAAVGDDGVLEVVVSVEGQEDETCVQCIGEVEYEAGIELTNAPGPVRVIHESGEERRVVGSVVCAE